MLAPGLYLADVLNIVEELLLFLTCQVLIEELFASHTTGVRVLQALARVLGGLSRRPVLPV